MRIKRAVGMAFSFRNHQRGFLVHGEEDSKELCRNRKTGFGI